MPNNLPPQLLAMQKITGTKWAPGDGPSETIAEWLASIAAEFPTTKAYCESVVHLDYFEWCGLAVGFCVTGADILPVFGTKDVDKFLYALAWLEWGDAVQTPAPGDIVVLDFGGGHQHVTLFESDLKTGYWACRGGNQSHEVKVSDFPKSCVRGVRRAKVPQAPADHVVAAPLPAPAADKPSTFSGGGVPLTQAGLDAAAKKLGVGPNEIWALTFTETDPPYGGFYADKRPQILFERHIFHGLTKGKYDLQYPDISNAKAGGYGAGGSHQYDRLALAMSLDETAALQSASWGIGQVLGENYKEAGYASPQEMVTRVFASEDEQLLAVANEILSDRNGKAAKALAGHDWKTFASIYNGPAYAENKYDSVISGWFQKFSTGGAPDIHVRTAQLYLMYLGLSPSDIDGSWGKRTRSAMNEYQKSKGLPVTDTLNDATYQAIEADGKAAKGAVLTAGV
jgi:N-acetylmuramidase/Putative peptidoglycan binding domain